MLERCTGFSKLFDEPDFNAFDLQHIEQVLNSYLGFCKGRRTYSFRRGYIERMGTEFWKYFYVRGSFKSVRLKQQYRLLN